MQIIISISKYNNDLGKIGVVAYTTASPVTSGTVNYTKSLAGYKIAMVEYCVGAKAVNARYHAICAVNQNISNTLIADGSNSSYNITTYISSLVLSETAFTISGGKFARSGSFGDFNGIGIILIRGIY